MEKVTLVETVKISDDEKTILGKAINLVADISDFVESEKAKGITVELPKELLDMLAVMAQNIEAIR